MYSLTPAKSQPNAERIARQSQHILLQSRTWHLCGAAIGLIAGTLFPITGFLLLAVERLAGAGSVGRWGHYLGTVLLLSAIPLLGLGGYCLDLLEKKSAQTDRQ